MNSNRRVPVFVLSCAGLLLLLSILAYIPGMQRWIPLRRANLVSDLVKRPEAPTDSLPIGPSIPIPEKIPAEDFNLYHSSHLITSFNADSSQPALPTLMQKLHALKTAGKGKIRIAYFGDSMIEGDLLTRDLRRLLQSYFGGSGVGFVPITSPVSGFRQTVNSSSTAGWENENFKEGKSRQLFLSGYLFHGNNATVQLVDRTIKDTSAIIEKSLLCGPITDGAGISVNFVPKKVDAQKPFNRVSLLNDKKQGITVTVNNPLLPIYGISFESETGVFVDNFSFRGITGVEYARIDSAFLSAIALENHYDLIVFQYGVNLLFRPNDKNYNWYAGMIQPVLRKLKNCFPGSDFILVSTADRAFRYDGEYKSAIGIDSLVMLQATLAYTNGFCFYNQYETMGGKNSIVQWAQAKPSLARQDYVHPNEKGASILAGYFYDALLRDWEKYSLLKK